jgi:hypothetical protein
MFWRRILLPVGCEVLDSRTVKVKALFSFEMPVVLPVDMALHCSRVVCNLF